MIAPATLRATAITSGLAVSYRFEKSIATPLGSFRGGATVATAGAFSRRSPADRNSPALRTSLRGWQAQLLHQPVDGCLDLCQLVLQLRDIGAQCGQLADRHALSGIGQRGLRGPNRGRARQQMRPPRLARAGLTRETRWA